MWKPNRITYLLGLHSTQNQGLAMKVKAIFVALCCLLYFVPSYGQATDTPKKQAIYVNLGSVIFENQLSLNFERLLFDTAPGFQTRLKLNAGTYLSNNYDYEVTAEINANYLSASLLQLISMRNVQLELNIGLARTQFTTTSNPEKQSKFRAYTLAGLRYSSNGWLVRTGFGNLELFHFGVGFEF